VEGKTEDLTIQIINTIFLDMYAQGAVDALSKVY
jgi:hypothetical protein